MIHIIRAVIWIFVVWRWGDWRNWQKYQSTILYFIMSDLLYNFLTYNHHLWKYESVFPFSNHTLTSLFIMFIIYPCVVLMYLPYYPKGWKQVPYIILWAFIISIIELINHVFNVMTYHNKWNFWHSVLFDIILFSMLRLHYKKPLLTYAISVVISVSLLLIFNVPIHKMK